MKKCGYRKALYLVLIVLWCLLIAWFSSQNGEVSKETSDIIADPIAGGNPELMYMVGFIIRKLAHFYEYLILGLLAMRLFLELKMRPILRWPLAWIFCVGYAISDEFHQTFISGRVGSPIDVLIDASGSLLGTLFILVLWLISVRKVETSV